MATANWAAPVLIAWQELVDVRPGSSTFGQPVAGLQPPEAEPRIVLMRSSDGGTKWTDINGVEGQRAAVDFADRDHPTQFPAPGLGFLPMTRASGPQVMPALSSIGGRTMLVYYESRGILQGSDNIVVGVQTTPTPFGHFIAGLDRMVDLRGALLNPATGALLGTAQISRYPLRPDANLADGEQLSDVLPVNGPCLPDNPGATVACVRSVNRMNALHSLAGKAPFMGDYVALAPIVAFVPNGQNGWKWAIGAQDVPYPRVPRSLGRQSPPDSADTTRGPRRMGAVSLLRRARHRGF